MPDPQEEQLIKETVDILLEVLDILDRKNKKG